MLGAWQVPYQPARNRAGTTWLQASPSQTDLAHLQNLTTRALS